MPKMEKLIQDFKCNVNKGQIILNNPLKFPNYKTRYFFVVAFLKGVTNNMGY